MKMNNQMIPTDSENSSPKAMNNGHKSLLNYTIKAVAFIAVIKAHNYNKDYNMHNNMILYTFYSMHLYMILDIILAMVKVLARTLLGVELEPHFNEP
ncbi:putative long-chain-alcohol O-fatty-acyltransferase [Lupinus albus]|uniref:Putative long-chain-alcohol O-fatty-acyltransferase n=1 Tax=Lupinus albus TaxID=3870 RepID=A0A6A4QV07_LUPAL|nr:putative long-chain-alcohol O-fatty-acyltransferase [Lupinus albus]